MPSVVGPLESGAAGTGAAESLRNKSSLLAISTACSLAPLLPTSAQRCWQLRLKVIDDSSIRPAPKFTVGRQQSGFLGVLRERAPFQGMDGVIWPEGHSGEIPSLPPGGSPEPATAWQAGATWPAARLFSHCPFTAACITAREMSGVTVSFT